MGNYSSSPADKEYVSDEDIFRRQKEVKNVLIMCQRKEDPEDPELAETNAALEDFIARNFFEEDDDVEDLRFEYLSALYSCDKGRYGKAKVDYNIKFENNAPTRAFVSDHLKRYSLVVLQTCPFIVLAEDETTTKFLSEIMADDGIIVATAISKENRKTFVNANISATILKTFASRGFESKSWKKYFKTTVVVGDDVIEGNSQIIFEKRKNE
jgi:hypothetical protein